MMNEQALKSMTKMIQVMLPYENKYEAQETGTRAIQEIIGIMRGINPAVSEFEGFLNYLMKQVDLKGDGGRIDIMLMEVWAIIDKYYPSSDLDYPEDLGEDEPEHVTFKPRGNETPITFHGVHSTET